MYTIMDPLGDTSPSHSNYFDDWDGEGSNDPSFHGVKTWDTPQISAINLRSGSIIDNIGATHVGAGGTPPQSTSHGGTNGNPHSFGIDIANGEYLKKIDVYYGVWPNDSSTGPCQFVLQLDFSTNKTKTPYTYGGFAGMPKTPVGSLYIAKQQIVALLGFWNGCDSSYAPNHYICALGAVFGPAPT